MASHKRKLSGDFRLWTSRSVKSSTPPPDLPQTKRRRTSMAEPLYSPMPSHNEASTNLLSSSSSISFSMSPVAFSPSGSQPSTSQPQKSSKPRKKANTDTPVPEKRGANFKKSCPKNILERFERVMSQRFFMIDRQKDQDELQEVFSVLGSTGNVYTVTVNHMPSCNCPDALKGHHCKHILFILLKVLQVPESSGLWYQKALLTSELETIFSQAPLAPNSIAHPSIRKAHDRATGKTSAVISESEFPQNKRLPGPDDSCPICYEDMHGDKEDSLVFCEECGNSLHKVCFGEWQNSTLKSGKPLTCVFCRARWASAFDTLASTSDIRVTNEGYLNLGNVAGISPIRDTSTYYHGPRKGIRSSFRVYLD